MSGPGPSNGSTYDNDMANVCLQEFMIESHIRGQRHCFFCFVFFCSCKMIKVRNKFKIVLCDKKIL